MLAIYGTNNISNKIISSFKIVLCVTILLLISTNVAMPSYMIKSFADQLTNALEQRIGNYDIQMKTDPNIAIPDQNTKIIVRISSVNGEELVDLPVVFRLSKDDVTLLNTTPIFVQYGHYAFNYKFSQPGVYALDINIKNDPSSGQDITFTFPINISNQFVGFLYSSLYFVLPAAAAASGIGIAIIVTIKHKKNSARSPCKI
jgi:hypothetical protein